MLVLFRNQIMISCLLTQVQSLVVNRICHPINPSSNTQYLKNHSGRLTYPVDFLPLSSGLEQLSRGLQSLVQRPYTVDDWP